MSDKTIQRERLNILIPAFATFIAILPYLIEGVPRGHDFNAMYIRAIEFRNAIDDGQWLPYWGPNHYEGRGSPIFLFYAPLLSAINSTLSYAFHILTSIKISLSTFAIISAVGIYLAMRELSHSNSSIRIESARIAVYIFVLNPYLLGNTLIRNANAEFAALCLAPFVFLGIFRFQRKPYSAYIIFTVSMTLIILTHNITALSITVISLIFLISLYDPRSNRKKWLAIIFAYIFSLLITSFYWLPALLYKDQIRSADLTTGWFDFHNNFTNPIELFFSGSFFAVGFAMAPLFLLSLAIMFIKRTALGNTARLCLTIITVAVSLLFLMSSASTVIWEHLPLLKFYQFPWRFAGPFVLLATLFIAISFSVATQSRNPKDKRIFELLVLLLCLLSAVPHLMKHYRFSYDEALAHLRHQRELGMPFRATARNEYAPTSLEPPNFTTSVANVMTHPNISIDVKTAQPRHLQFTTTNQERCAITIGRWSFPGWSIMIDGINTDHKKSPTGLIEFILPAGSHTVQAISTPPTLRIVFTYVSLISLVLFLLHVLYLRKQIQSEK
jgi:hypothetical protein